MIVNYPVRRRITSVLMIIGNLGLVGVFATLVASIVQTEGDVNAVVTQLGWLLAGIALLWFLMLNKTADRVMCSLISRLLNATTQLGRRSYHRVLQIGDGLSVCEHPLAAPVDIDGLESMGLTLMAVRDREGNIHRMQNDAIHKVNDGWLIAYGDDSAHDALATRTWHEMHRRLL